MLSFILLAVPISSLITGLVADDRLATSNGEFKEKVAEVVRTILQEDFSRFPQLTILEMQKKLTEQEKRIKLLETRDRQRENVFSDVLLRMKYLKKSNTLFERRIQFLESRDNRRGNAIKDLLLDLKVLNESYRDGQKAVNETVIQGDGLTQKYSRDLEASKTVNELSKRSKHSIIQTDVNKQARRAEENVGFTAYLDHNVDHMAVGHTIKMNQVLLNDGSGYNPVTGVFTAPVTGVYLFNFHYNSHYRKTLVGLFVDGVNEVDAISVPKDSTQEMMGGNTAVLRVTAGQTVWLEDIIAGDGELFSGAGYRYATLSGVLLY